MRTRLLTTLAVTALLASPLAPARGAAPQDLAGQTVVAASGPAKALVRIPRRTRLSMDPARSVRIDGPGRLVGLILRENHEQPEETSLFRLPPQLGGRVVMSGLAEQTYSCTSPLPDPLSGYGQDCTGGPQPHYYSLRRGTYTLYALTDGAPLRVTLRFEDLPGSTTVVPARRVDQGTVPFALSFDPGTTKAVWSGGAAARPKAAADLLTVGWWTSDESPAASEGACWYAGDGIEQLGRYRWLPGCPGASSGTWSEVRDPVYGTGTVTKAGLHGGMATTSTAGAGTFGLGIWTSAMNVRDAGGLAVWLGH